MEKNSIYFIPLKVRKSKPRMQGMLHYNTYFKDKEEYEYICL